MGKECILQSASQYEYGITAALSGEKQLSLLIPRPLLLKVPMMKLRNSREVFVATCKPIGELDLSWKNHDRLCDESHKADGE